MIINYKIFSESINTITLYHAGNLEKFDYKHLDKVNFYRTKYGYGMYLTDTLSIAEMFFNEDKYKDNEHIYEITLKKGNNIHNTSVFVNSIIMLVEKYGIKSKLKPFKLYVEKYNLDGKVNTEIVYDYIFNNKLFKAENVKYLVEFFVNNGIDYDIKYNLYNEKDYTYMLFNLNLIMDIKIIK